MKKDDIIATARARMDEAATADQRNRELAKEDLSFAVGEQWREEDRRKREADGKPTLTINAMPQFIRQVTGQIRQLNPAIKVSPADNQATDDVAEIYEGLIRSIQYASDAPSVFEAAAESAAACGIGHFRIRADYAPGLTFDQEILIERIHNPFAVFWDPQAKDPTRADAKFCFVIDEMGKEDFKAEYPDAHAEGLTSQHKDQFDAFWFKQDTVTVAEYFWIDHKSVKIGMLDTGEIVRDPVAPLNIIRTRTVQEPVVKWAKLTGADVLEGPQELPGRYIPVLSVTGEEWHLGEEMYRCGVIRFAKDPQRLYNFARSTLAEVTAGQPKAPWLVTPEQIRNLETYWQSANTENYAYLPYNPDPKAPGAPQRVQPPVPAAGLVNELQLAGEDMKRTTGIYDASLGARSNETSGIAIAQRKQEAQMGTSIYSDNLMKAIRHAGCIIVDMIPRIYDTQRTIKIMGEDDTEQLVAINQVMQNADGSVYANDLTVGNYAVRVSVGPNYDTKRQESSSAMIEFIKAFPQAAALTGDLVAKAQDWPDSDQFAARLRKALPPGVIPIEDLPEDEKQAAMQQQQQNGQMQQAAMQMQMAKAQAEIRKTVADASESEADAQKAAAEAVQKQIETMMMSGQMQALIQQAAQQMLLQQMQAMQAPQPVPMVMQTPGGGMPL